MSLLLGRERELLVLDKVKKRGGRDERGRGRRTVSAVAGHCDGWGCFYVGCLWRGVRSKGDLQQ